MAVSFCPECQEILREMRELVELSRQHAPGERATIREMIAWFEQRDLDEEYTLHVRPALSSARRRLVEHGTATGHHVMWQIPPGGLITPN